MGVEKRLELATGGYYLCATHAAFMREALMRAAFMRVAFMRSARIPAAEAAAQLAPSLGCTRAFSGGGII